MKQNKILYMFTLIAINFIAISCSDENLSTQYPPSPVNISNAITFNPNLKYDSVVDIDGNTYKTITIGKQTWMAENLRVTSFRNGDKVPHVPHKNDWVREDSYGNLVGVLGLCVYDNNNSKDSIARYGLLYSISVMTDVRGIAPLGWHIAKDSEWSVLINSPDFEKSGFTPLFAGYRQSDGLFAGRGENDFWVSSELSNRYMYHKKGSNYLINCWTDQPATGMLWRIGGGSVYGYSIRCVKD